MKDIEFFDDYADRLDAIAPTEDNDDSDIYAGIFVPFGKHRDQSLLNVAESDPGYLDWMKKAHREGFFDSIFILDWMEKNVCHFDGARLAVNKRKVAAVDVNLTEHQTEVTDQTLDFILKYRLNIVRLQGGAGYGKSYATQRLVVDLTNAGYTIRATAVSYVATEVLRVNLDHLGVECGTLARMLKFTKGWDDDGNEVYSHSADTPTEARSLLSDNNVLIVDEAGMINDKDAKLLFDTVNAAGGVLLLVGDVAQLPPVKQDTPAITCGEWDTGVATLTEPMRYSRDSELFGVEQLSRTNPGAIFSEGALPPESTEEISVVRSTSALIDSYVRQYEADPAATHRMLLFRRDDVTQANAAIRAGLFGADAPVVVEDERLMVLATSDYPYADKARSLGTTRYYSGTSFRVLKVHEGEYAINIDGEEFAIPHHVVQFDDQPRSVRVIFAVSDKRLDTEKLGSAEMTAALAAARKFAKKTDKHGTKLGSWAPYQRLMGDFVRVAYQYATSVHRAQGQTCDYAYCAPRTLLAVRGIMGAALTYVALTRARKHLTLLV